MLNNNTDVGKYVIDKNEQKHNCIHYMGYIKFELLSMNSQKGNSENDDPSKIEIELRHTRYAIHGPLSKQLRSISICEVSTVARVTPNARAKHAIYSLKDNLYKYKSG